MFKSLKNFSPFISNSDPSNSSVKVGKLSVGKHSKLKSKFSPVKLNLFSDFILKLRFAFEEIFLKISYSTVAEVVVLPSLIISTSFISSQKIISKSVATIDSFLFFNSSRTFERIGKVFFFSTTP